MFHHKKNILHLGGAKPHMRGLWQILMPAFLYVVLYSLLQYAGTLVFRHLRASGPEALKAFTSARPGTCMVFIMFFSTSLSLMAVSREGIVRLRYFRKRNGNAGSRGEKGRKAAAGLFLAGAASALCIFGNALIQVMGLHSESVNSMQPIYSEIPFFFVLLIFAVVTPFAEEFVFRGLIYTGLRSCFSAVFSIIAAAALFGLYHGEAIQGAYAFCMGLLLGLSMELTEDLRIPWLLHGIANGLPLCLSYFGGWEIFLRSEWRTGTLVCLLAFLVLLRAFSSRKYPGGISRD